MKPTISIDLCEVIYPWCEIACILIQDRFKLNVKPPTQYVHKAEDWPLPQEVWNWLNTEAIDHGLYWLGFPEPDTLRALSNIRNKYEVHIVTQRPSEAFVDTAMWVHQYEIPHDVFHFLPKEMGIKKSTIGCDVYVDDSPYVVEDVCDNGKQMFLWHRPHNSHIRGNFTRVYNWSDLECGLSL